MYKVIQEWRVKIIRKIKISLISQFDNERKGLIRSKKRLCLS